MRVANLFEKKHGKPVISFEFSRPKTEKAAANLEKALDKLVEAKPDYVSVTFGAGGSTREGSFELVDKLKNERGLPTVAYLAGVGLGPEDLTTCLGKFKDMGIETIFAIRGDPPTWDENYKPHPEALNYASDLIGFIKGCADFCLGAAVYPEGHIEAESLEKDLEYDRLKQDKGAEYIVAQYFYDNQYFFDFMDKARAAGISVPIVPGIMPIYTVKLMENLAKVCGATITQPIRDGLAKLPPDDKKAVVQFGIDFSTEQCRGLLEHGVAGLHFYTMNRSKSVCAILETLRGEGLL
ncbi:MAG: methylenetetrahydrofolate reductase, partial [Deltaproteobacteria bacterium]|nr:methylenetetrahydrofolate reductase [Deltaproteobacteria bacterium]